MKKSICSMPTRYLTLWMFTCTQGDYRQTFYVIGSYRDCMTVRRQQK